MSGEELRNTLIKYVNVSDDPREEYSEFVKIGK